MADQGASLGAIYDPSRALSGKSLRNAAKSLTNLQTQPAINQLARQLAESRQQAAAATQTLGGYYNQFADHAQQAAAQRQTAGDKSGAALAQIAQDARDQIAATGTTAQQQLQPLADRGLDGGAYARLASALAARQTTAAENAQTYRSFGAAQGANWHNLLSSESTTGAMRGMEALHELGDAYAKADVEPAAKLAELRAGRGDVFAKNLGALRDSERSYQTARDTLGLNAQKEADQVAYQQGSLDVRRGDQALRASAQHARDQAHADEQSLNRAQFVAKYGIAPGDLNKLQHPGQWLRSNAPVYHDASHPAKLTPHQINAAFGDIDAAKSAILQVRRLLDDATPEQVRDYLSEGKVQYKDGNRVLTAQLPHVSTGGYGLAAKVAMDLVYRGRISPANLHQLHVQGLWDVKDRYPIQG